MESVLTREIASELLVNLLPNYNQALDRQISDQAIHEDYKKIFLELQGSVTAHKRCNMQTLANLSIINSSYLRTLNADQQKKYKFQLQKRWAFIKSRTSDQEYFWRKQEPHQVSKHIFGYALSEEFIQERANHYRVLFRFLFEFVRECSDELTRNEIVHFVWAVGQLKVINKKLF